MLYQLNTSLKNGWRTCVGAYAHGCFFVHAALVRGEHLARSAQVPYGFLIFLLHAIVLWAEVAVMVYNYYPVSSFH